MNGTKNINPTHIPLRTTQEDLECDYECKTLNYGEKVLMTGYKYNPSGPCYYAAVYEHTDEDLTCEGFLSLVDNSVVEFEDEGHAIAWALQRA